MHEIFNQVFTELGKGHRETVYQKALEVELRLRGIPYECERVLPITYKGHVVSYMRMDLVVDGNTIIELKSIKSLKDGDECQLRRYLTYSNLKEGYLVNFSTEGEIEVKHLTRE